MVTLTLVALTVLVGAAADARYQRWLETRGL